MKTTLFSLLLSVLCSLFSYVYGQEVSTDIKSLLSSQGKVVYGDEPNSIMVIDYPQNLQRVAEYLKAIDTPPQQVLIEARVVEVKLQKEHALGVNWSLFAEKGYMPLASKFRVGSNPIAGLRPGPLTQTIPFKPTFFPPGQSTSGQETPFTISIFDDNINVVVQTLANSLDTNILSAPRVTTVNNRQAEIKIIQRLPWAEPTLTETTGATGGSSVSVTWKINFEEVGIILKATPTINDDGKVAMVLEPEVSEKTSDLTLTVKQGDATQTYTVPIIDKRTASTKVVIGNGQTLIIGGLIKDKTTQGVSKIPLLGDIPGLGYLFKSKKDTRDKTELLIFVSPKIITPNEFVQMAKEENLLWNKNYPQERQRQIKKHIETEQEKKKKHETLSTKAEMLSQKQKALIEERKKLEETLIQERLNLKALKETTTTP